MRLYLLENPTQPYSWGSPHGLTECLGVPNPGGGPLAELWMGAHPMASSSIVIHGEKRRLDGIIAERASAFLGRRASERFGKSLPFLLKAISAAAPLSIQAHPARRKAERGFDRENLAGIPIDAPERNYRDRNHKPEMVVALTPFEGLFGFRPIPEILENLRLALPDGVTHHLDRLEKNPGRVELSVLFYSLMSIGGTARSELVTATALAVEKLLTESNLPEAKRPAFEWIGRLRESYPDDTGVLSPLFLNHVVLAPGEALFVAPGELHAYFRGECLELMANSDNVLRGGLTKKHVDLPELISVLSFDSFAALPFRAQATGAGHSGRGDEGQEELFPLLVPDFRLSRVTVVPARMVSRYSAGPEILLCTEGRVVLSDGSDALVLERGGSAFVRADAGPWTLEGEGVVHRAFLPEAGGPA